MTPQYLDRGNDEDDHETHGLRCACVVCVFDPPPHASANFMLFAIILTAYITPSCWLPAGVPIPGQLNLLRQGVDIVVGTPGRVQDLMENGSHALRLDNIR